MKKFTHRLLPLALCFTLTLGAFAYRPPQAEAVVGVDDAVVIGALLSAFAGGCGLIFSNNGMTSSELAQGLTDKWNEFNESAENAASSFAAWLGFEDTSALLGALSFSGSKLVIPRAIARKFADFTTWLTSDLGVTAGGDSASIASSNMQKLNCPASDCTIYENNWSDYYTTSLYDNSVGIEAISSKGSLAYKDFVLRTPIFVAPETGQFAIFFSCDTSSVLKGSDSNYGCGFWDLILYNTDTADSDTLTWKGSVLKNERWTSGGTYANSGPFSGSANISLVKGQKYCFNIRFGAQDAFLSANFAWNLRIQHSTVFSDLSIFAPSYYKNPTIDLPAEGEEAVNPTLSGVGDGTATTVEDLLQQILAQLQANTLAPTLDVAGTETGGGTDTDEDSKPYLPYIPQIFEKIKELPGTLANIWETVKGIPAAIAEKIGAFFTTLWGWLQNIIDAITALPAAIAEKIGELFKPDEALLTEITDAFKGKFGFFSTLKQFGSDLFGMTPESEPPVIWVHLENAESKYGYNYGDKQKIFDMTWYQKYKASVDGLLSGFLWLGYLWLLFKRAPAILGGMQMDEDLRPPLLVGDVSSAPRLGAGDPSMHYGEGFTFRSKGGKRK